MRKLYLIVFLVFVLSPLEGASQLSIEAYKVANDPRVCYDRETMPHTAVVDTHLHFRPFVVRAATPFEQIVRYLKDADVLFANIYGIGQVLPAASACMSLSEDGCEEIPLRPSMRNDILNAENLMNWRISQYIYNRQDIYFVLSMTFPDLSNPLSILSGIHFLDNQYSPRLFRWMGEVNLVKEHFFEQGIRPVPKSKISEWGPFMTILRHRNIPLALHSDLGNNEDPTKYISWMEEVLGLYPDNTIIWMHAGISKKLNAMDPDQHIETLSSFLDRFDNLMLDFSWRILDDYYFSTTSNNRRRYVNFINRYPTRILPGTDFITTNKRDFSSYSETLEITSDIYQYVSDEAFRNIALGENYFRIINIRSNTQFRAPSICE